jgi:dTDP-4-dehydrorhamnose reductase
LSQFTVAFVKVLITGAAGLIGSHAAQRLYGEHQVVALKQADLDISDRESVGRLISDAKPNLIVNGAVIQVDESEQNPAQAYAVNVEGPRKLAEAANRVGAEFVHFSSQYAFDGQAFGRAPYTIEDQPRPINVYGKTKVASERAVLDACPRSYIIRTSWVYGSGKESFLCTAHRDLRSGKRIRAIADIWSSTTYVEDLIERILQILEHRRYGIYHVVNEGVCSYHEFALEAGRLVGLNRERMDSLVEVLQEAEMKRVAARPRYTPMRCLISEELGLPSMRSWQSALAAYVQS